MCGSEDSTATPVVSILPGLDLCTDCIKFIDQTRDEQLKSIHKKNEAKEKKAGGKIPKAFLYVDVIVS